MAGVQRGKGDADQRRPVRTSPLIAQIDWRPKLEPLRRQLLIQLIDQLFEQRSADLETNVRDSLRQQRMPFAFPIRGQPVPRRGVGQGAYLVLVAS